MKIKLNKCILKWNIIQLIQLIHISTGSALGFRSSNCYFWTSGLLAPPSVWNLNFVLALTAVKYFLAFWKLILEKAEMKRTNIILDYRLKRICKAFAGVIEAENYSIGFWRTKYSHLKSLVSGQSITSKRQKLQEITQKRERHNANQPPKPKPKPNQTIAFVSAWSISVISCLKERKKEPFNYWLNAVFISKLQTAVIEYQ